MEMKQGFMKIKKEDLDERYDLKDDRKDLIERGWGEMENGKWDIDDMED